jgi:hypothetical protein
MTDEDIAAIEASQLARLIEATRTAQLGENSTVEEARAFLIQSFEALRVIAQMRAGIRNSAQRMS